jgi:2-polyprenyl-6-methoxyphenol hydroxylase-like FAD-dependent oxidoreductase
MAIEDAVVLGRSLRGISAGDIPGALSRYEAERRRRAEMVVEWGRRNAAPKVRGQFKRVFEDLVLKAVFRSLARKAADNFDWLYHHHIDWDGPVVPGGPGAPGRPVRLTNPAG